MSSQKSLASFLQQDVTIVTDQELRYQGKLYSYDHEKLTITLQDVRCFGTEQRATSLPVPPRKDIFQFVVFNANKIKSFQPISNENGLSDPAIISMDNATGSSRNKRGSPKKSSAPSHAQSSLMKMLDNGHSQLRTVDMNRLMGGNSGPAQRQNNRNNKRKNKRENQSKQETQEESSGRTQRSNKKGQNDNNSNRNPRHVSFKTDSSKQTGERRQFTRVPQIPRKALNRDNRRSSSQEPKTTEMPGKFATPKTPVKFDEEFDFDKALEEFKELSTSDKSNKEKASESAETNEGGKSTSEAGDTAADTVEAVYDQDKSFFDKLTTTTENNGQQRLSRKEVMQTNKETFGVSYLPGRRFRNRNGHSQRHSGKQSNGRGGRRQQNNSNNHHHANDVERSLRRMLAVY